MTLWIGVDGNAEIVAVRSTEILQALLRQAREAGQRLDAVVCNGKTIYGDTLQHKSFPFIAPGDTP